MTADEIRVWVENRRVAAAREQSEIRNCPMPAAEAFRLAMQLLRFDEVCNGSPFNRNDPVADREDEHARLAWVTLRKRWR